MASSWYLTPNPHLSSSPLLEIHFVISFYHPKLNIAFDQDRNFLSLPNSISQQAGRFNEQFHWKAAPKSNPSSATIICNLRQYCVASVFPTINDSQCNAQSTVRFDISTVLWKGNVEKMWSRSCIRSGTSKPRLLNPVLSPGSLPPRQLSFLEQVSAEE